MSDLKITFAGQAFTFEPGQTVRIGRSPDNSVIVSDPIVSRDHARVTWRSDEWVLDDLGKGRTFVAGLPIASLAVKQPLDVHLATPRGPELRIELAGESLAGQDVAGQDLAGEDEADTGPPAAADPADLAAADAGGLAAVAAGAAGAAAATGGPLATPAGAGASASRTTRHPSAVHREELWRGDISGEHSSPVYQHLPAHHARLDSPGGEFATAVHILVPVLSWLKDPGWKQGSRLLVIAYGLLPSLFVVLFSATSDLSAPGWAYSLAI
ncbi:MAG: FHA domain-containing protein, partial [Nocardiopsaceae bacterium]|nr:FHA domain-containing protein [Nocardiopsaceae bacterium]